ncbi:MAG: hypothetical protein ACYTAN_11160 [Planctomycetota bacterium]|jgi:hypothetical protein
MPEDAGDSGRRNRALPLSTVDILALAAIPLCVLVFFRRVVLGGAVFFFRDFGLFFYPRRLVAVHAARSLSIPLWDSLSGGGQAFVGAYQTAFFYPPALLYYLLPMPWSFMLFVVVHFALTGCGMYLLLRYWNLRRLSSLAGALLWAFAPPLVSVVDNVSFLTSLSWLPWCALFAEFVLRRGKFPGFLGLSVSLALSILAGAPEPVLFAGLLLAALLARHVWRLRGAGRAALRGPALLLGSLAVGALLAGSALVPLIEHLPASKRPGRLSEQEAGAYSLPPADLANAAFPTRGPAPERGGIDWPGQRWLKSVYLGIAVLILAIAAVPAGKRGPRIALAGAAVFFLLLSMGQYLPVWRFLYRNTPVLGFVRYPVKFFVPGTFCVICLGAIGLDRVSGALARAAGRAPRVGRILLSACPVVISALVVGDFLLCSRNLNPTGGPSLYAPPAGTVNMGSADGGAARVWMTPELRRYADRIRIGRFDGFAGLADHLAQVKGDEYRDPAVTARWLKEAAGVAVAGIAGLDEHLRGAESVDVAEAAQYEFFKEVLYPDSHLLCGFANADTGEVLQTKWSWDLREALKHSANYRAIQRLFAVKWVIGYDEEAPHFVYREVADATPRAALVGNVITAASDEEALQLVDSPSFDPRESVVLTRADAAGLQITPDGDAAAGTVQWIADTGNGQVLEVESASAALLYVADNYHPAVKACLDGSAVPLYRANYAFRAVEVPAGPHTVEFTFGRGSLWRGVVATLCGLAVIAIAALRARRNRRAIPVR